MTHQPFGVTAEQVAFFQREGYLVLPDFASAEEVAALLARADELLRAFEPSANPSVFSTTKQTETSDEYFLRSANNVSFFLEPGALDAHGQLRVPRHLAVNKIGHALHDLDPVLGPWSRSAKVAALLRALGLARPLPMQSMYLCKPPVHGGVVVPHQDSCFLDTEPDSCHGLWVALEDAGRENGCLWAVPRSHKGGVRGRFVLDEHRKTLWSGGVPPEYPPFGEDSQSGWVPLEANAGTAVLLHGATVHASAANTSLASRHAYSVHYVDAEATWQPTNWLQRDEDFPAVAL